MSKLIKAFTDLIEGNSKASHKKAKEAETFKRSEFKKLIQQELPPVKVTTLEMQGRCLDVGLSVLPEERLRKEEGAHLLALYFLNGPQQWDHCMEGKTCINVSGHFSEVNTGVGFEARVGRSNEKVLQVTRSRSAGDVDSSWLDYRAIQSLLLNINHVLLSPF